MLDSQELLSQQNTMLTFNPFAKKQNSYYPFVKINLLQKIVKHIAFWGIAFAVILYLLLYVKPFTESLERDIVNLLAFMLLFYSSRYFVYAYYERKDYTKWLLWGFLTTSVLAIARTTVEVFVIGTTLFSSLPFAKLPQKLQFAQFTFYFILGHIFFMLFTFYNISKRRSTLEHRLNKFKLKHTELQLKTLNAQLDPHFLFNTLNSIYAISILDPEKTPELILKLSETLRFITQNSQLKRIPLLLEVEQTRNFLELFKLRNDVPVNISMDVSEGLAGIDVMPMTLLPLVENAMKYGNLMSEKKGCFVKITVNKKKEQVQIEVVNSYDKAITKENSNGLGNRILRQRLELEYPKTHQFITSEENKCFKAELKITV